MNNIKDRLEKPTLSTKLRNLMSKCGQMYRPKLLFNRVHSLVTSHKQVNEIGGVI